MRRAERDERASKTTTEKKVKNATARNSRARVVKAPENQRIAMETMEKTKSNAKRINARETNAFAESGAARLHR